MSHRRDERRHRQPGSPPQSSGDRERADDRGQYEPGRTYDRNEDMGGSGWSGASGRGGMTYDPDQPWRAEGDAQAYGPRQPRNWPQSANR